MVVHLVDDRLNRKDYPKLYNLLDRSLETALAVNENCKNHWNTKRPFVSEKKIKALIEPSQNPAYPSGHAASSQVLARILGQLIPEKSEAFMARAEEISNHRVLVGMHYPHDIIGGKKMALIILGALFASDDFAKDYQSAKEEINSKYPKNFVSKN
jgi:acid phosphatase (class A)